MKRSVCHYLAVLFVLFALPLQLGATDVVLNNTRARVFFSPGGGATKAILRQIGEAEREVLVEAYLFTSKPIQAALLKARKRGIEVEVILDGHEQKERKHVTARVLKAGGVDVWLDNDHASAHNKVILQLYLRRRGQERREPPHHNLRGAGRPVQGQLSEAQETLEKILEDRWHR